MNKNSYEVNLEDVIFRRAEKDDNMEEIASLIYQTDPYIYPFWFNENINEAKKVLSEEIQKEGFIFYYENIYVAYDKKTEKIVGIVCAIDPTTNLNYDYTKLESVNHNYKFTIEHYIKELIKEEEEKEYMYISNVCIDENYRSRRIGSRMAKSFIDQMHNVAKFDKIGFDCLMHNLRAKNLYHSLGFKEVAEGIGFDGTENSTVEIVFFIKKRTKYTDEDFQMLPSSDVKKIDLEREKYLYDSLTVKKQSKKM